MLFYCCSATANSLTLVIQLISSGKRWLIVFTIVRNGLIERMENSAIRVVGEMLLRQEYNQTDVCVWGFVENVS